MKKQKLYIEEVPAMLWGPKTGNVMIGVHGDQASKTDPVMEIVAEVVVPKGIQLLTFDLPEHGERKGMLPLCKVQKCVEELGDIFKYAQSSYEKISLFGCSIGAYFSMLAYRNKPVQEAYFLSPVVDMKRLIENMMGWFSVTEEQLKKEQEIQTPVKTLYWDYYQYVREHPVVWNKKTAILYGAKDSLCEADVVQQFARQAKADMAVMEEGEHFFHTEKQLEFFRKWLDEKLENEQE